jgi:hypothetical protein
MSNNRISWQFAAGIDELLGERHEGHSDPLTARASALQRGIHQMLQLTDAIQGVQDAPLPSAETRHDRAPRNVRTLSQMCSVLPPSISTVSQPLWNSPCQRYAKAALPATRSLHCR